MILFCFFMFFLLIIFSQVYLVNLYHSYDFILFIYAIFKTKIDICYLKKKKNKTPESYFYFIYNLFEVFTQSLCFSPRASNHF
jgi:hypothetical protein